jgi:hypothetical protein
MPKIVDLFWFNLEIQSCDIASGSWAGSTIIVVVIIDDANIFLVIKIFKTTI